MAIITSSEILKGLRANKNTLLVSYSSNIRITRNTAVMKRCAAVLTCNIQIIMTADEIMSGWLDSGRYLIKISLGRISHLKVPTKTSSGFEIRKTDYQE